MDFINGVLAILVLDYFFLNLVFIVSFQGKNWGKGNQYSYYHLSENS